MQLVQEYIPPSRESRNAAAVERFQQELLASLRMAGVNGWRGISLELQGGTVTLHGAVGSYYYKQLTQSIILRHPGVVQLRNEITVQEDHSEMKEVGT